MPTKRSTFALVVLAFVSLSGLGVRTQATQPPSAPQTAPPTAPATQAAPAPQPPSTAQGQPGQPSPAVSDFTVRATPDSITARRGSSASVTVDVKPTAGFAGRVRFVSSLLLGTDVVFTPAAVDREGTSTLTVTPSRTAIKGSYVLSITAIDGGISHTITVNVNVR